MGGPGSSDASTLGSPERIVVVSSTVRDPILRRKDRNVELLIVVLLRVSLKKERLDWKQKIAKNYNLPNRIVAMCQMNRGMPSR